MAGLITASGDLLCQTIERRSRKSKPGDDGSCACVRGVRANCGMRGEA
jgi:hypothetical protein